MFRDYVEKHITKWSRGESPSGLSERLLSAGLRGASLGWMLGSAVKMKAYDWGIRKGQSIECPVLCIGNLSSGGTGKTPMVRYVASFLVEKGRRPAIVSRGYGRESGDGAVLVSDGESVLVGRKAAGDEPFYLAQNCPGVAVAVGSSRVDAARLVLERCDVDVIVLDDGFQHRALRRDSDIVLWDSTQPMDTAALLPRGLLREGFSALDRARALVLTRCNLSDNADDMFARVKQMAPHLSVFRNGLEACGLKAVGEESIGLDGHVLAGASIGAFCGIGNPESFWRLLESEEARLVHRHGFPDHCRPSVGALQDFERAAVEKGAAWIAITEKDLVNLPAEWKPGIPVYAVVTRLFWEGGAGEFERFLLEEIERAGVNRVKKF